MVAFAAIISLVCLVLVALTVSARATRVRRDRWIQERSAPQRRHILQVASGEDDDGSATAALQALTGPTWAATRDVVVGMLAKVRGAPADGLVDIIAAHGDLAAAHQDLHSSWISRRARGAHLLGLARDEDAVADLIRLTRDSSPQVRRVAVRSLGQIGDPSAAGAVLNSVVGPGPDPAVPAWVVAEALLEMGPEAEDVVRAGLTHGDARIRSVALTVASHSVMPTTVPILRERFVMERDPVLRSEVAVALGRVGAQDEVELLVAGTAESKPTMLRLACAEGLGQIGHPDALERLVQITADPDRRLSQLAADQLLAAGDLGHRLLQEAAVAQGQQVAGAVAAALTLARLHAGELPGPVTDTGQLTDAGQLTDMSQTNDTGQVSEVAR